MQEKVTTHEEAEHTPKMHLCTTTKEHLARAPSRRSHEGRERYLDGKFNLIFYFPDAPPLLKIRNNADLNWTTCVTAVVDNKGQRGLNYAAQRCQTVTWEGE